MENITLPSLYYLPGRGGLLSKGLGAALSERGLSIVGRETSGDFAQLSFQEQVELIAADLTQGFWGHDSRVIANSYGAYLCLHALRLLPPYPGKLLLLSPIVGEFSNDTTGIFFLPPRSRLLARTLQNGKFPAIARGEIHVGALDWQSNPKNVDVFARALSLRLHVIAKMGHQLEHAYVSDLIDRWLLS